MTTLDKLKNFLSNYFIPGEIDSRHTFIRDEIQGRVDNAKNILFANTYAQELYTQAQNKIPASKRALLNQTILPYLSKFTNIIISGTVSVIAWPLSLFRVKSFTDKAAQEKTHQDLQRQNGIFTTLGVVSFAAVYDWFISLRSLVLLGALYGSAKLGLEKFRSEPTKVEPEVTTTRVVTEKEKDIESDPTNSMLSTAQLRKRGGKKNIENTAKVVVEVETNEENTAKVVVEVETNEENKKVEETVTEMNAVSPGSPKPSSP